MAIPKIGETITIEEFNKLPGEINVLSELSPTPFLQQAKLSFGNQGEQKQIINPPGLDIGDIGRQAGKLPGLLGFLGGAGLGTAVSLGNPLSPLAVGGAAAGTNAGEAIRFLIGKSLGVQKGTTLEEQTKQQAIESVRGATSQVISGVLQLGLNKLFPKLKKPAVSIAEKTVGPIKQSAKEKALDKSIDTALAEKYPGFGFKSTKSVGEKFLEEGGPDTGRGIIETAKLTKKAIGANMDVVINQAGKKAVETTDLPDGAYDLLSQYAKSLNLDSKVLSSIKRSKSLPTEDVVMVYRKIYDFLPSGSWDKLDPSMSWQKEALRRIAGQMSSKVEKIIPEMTSLNESYGLWSAIHTTVRSKLSKGGAFTLPQLTRNLANKTITSFPVRTGAAFGLNKLSQLQVTNTAQRLGGAGLLELLNQKE